MLDRHEAARRCTHQIATTILLIVSSGIGHLKVRAEMLKATEGAGAPNHLGRVKEEIEWIIIRKRWGRQQIDCVLFFVHSFFF